MAKLSVDGLLRCTLPFPYPKSVAAHLFAFLGAPPVKDNSAATGASQPSGTAAANSFAKPAQQGEPKVETLASLIVSDAEEKHGDISFQLGNIYLFEEATDETDVLFLYMLGTFNKHLAYPNCSYLPSLVVGPNYYGNLDVDLALFQTYDIINCDTVKLMITKSPIASNATLANRRPQAASSALSMREVSFSGEVPTREEYRVDDAATKEGFSEAISDDAVNDQWESREMGRENNAFLLLDPALYNDKMSHLDDKIVFLFSARNMVMAQSFRIDGFGTARYDAFL